MLFTTLGDSNGLSMLLAGFNVAKMSKIIACRRVQMCRITTSWVLGLEQFLPIITVKPVFLTILDFCELSFAQPQKSTHLYSTSDFLNVRLQPSIYGLVLPRQKL